MRHLIIAALLLGIAGTPACAQPVTSGPTLTLDHVGIQAADLDRSAAFYRDVLGLHEQPAPFPRGAVRWFSLGGGRMLHIVAHGSSASPHNRWDHFALACSDFDTLIVHLNTLRVPWTDMDGHHTIQTRPDHVRQIFVRDPDGYNIEINDAK